MLKRTVISCAAALMLLGAVSANALTQFEQDVAATIDLGLKYLDQVGAFNNPSSAGDGSGLSMLALLEKRQQGDQTAPPDGYQGASDADRARLRRAAAYILDRVNETSFYAYRDGAWLTALSLYRTTGGPDKGEAAEIPNTADYVTIDQAIAMLVDRITAAQGSNPGMWGYTGPGSDSSTTQFAVAGLLAVKRVYLDARYPDATRLAKVDAALAKARATYESTTYNQAGFEYSYYYGCGVLSASERGFNYSAGYTPSIQQTASGLWVQLAGGAGPNSEMVKNFVEWLRNRYIWYDPWTNTTDPLWGGNSYWYYLWSSFKGMQLLREQPGGAALANTVGTLAPADAPACSFRMTHRKAEGDLAIYAGTAQSQYFDYATRIMENQCKTGTNAGDFSCGNEHISWEGWIDRNPYAILVLQRSTGGACTDANNNGICDSEEGGDEGGPPAFCDMNDDGKLTSADLAILAPLARAKTATTPANQAGDVVGFVYSSGRSWWQEKPDGVINVADYTYCIFKVAAAK